MATYMKVRIHWFTLLAFLLAGCATHRPAVSSPPNALRGTNSLHIRFEVAALIRDSTPATFSFQKAKGKLGSAREGFTEAAELAVGGPAYSVIIPGMIMGEVIQRADDQGQLFLGAAGAGLAGGATVVGIAVASPAIATHGLIQSWRKISPDELAEREATLSKAMSEIAAQGLFQKFLLEAAAQKSPGRLLSIETADQPDQLPDSIDAVLEARVEDLRLERSRSDEGSYFLLIKVRTRLLRRADHTLLYEQPVEYRSRHSLFLDWTLHGAVQGVAETGYRELAQYIVERIL